eukprot:5815753-Prymnesium_polylepis.1
MAPTTTRCLPLLCAHVVALCAHLSPVHTTLPRRAAAHHQAIDHAVLEQRALREGAAQVAQGATPADALQLAARHGQSQPR